MAMAASSAVCKAIPCHQEIVCSSSSSSALPPLKESKVRLLRRVSDQLSTSFFVSNNRRARVLLKSVRSSTGEVEAPVSEKVASDGGDVNNWVPVIPLSALPKGERRLIRQDGEDVLLLWYKNEVIAIENTSPAEGAYSEGLVNAKLTQDGCIVCPTTDSTFDLKTGEIKEWFPSNPVLRILTPPLRNMVTYPVKVDSEFIYIGTQASLSGESAEVIFGGQVQAGKSAANVEVDEVRMVIDEGERGFGFTPENEITNGRSAMVGFTVLLIFELITGKGFLKGTGFLDFLYQYLPDFPILRY